MCHGTMPDEAREYRTVDVRASGTGYEYLLASFLVPQMMSDFVDWLNSSAGADNRPVDFASEAHFALLQFTHYVTETVELLGC
jgi:Fic family protein